jgi:hypothetical protein
VDDDGTRDHSVVVWNSTHDERVFYRIFFHQSRHDPFAARWSWRFYDDHVEADVGFVSLAP